MPNFELRLNDQLEFQLHLLKIVMKYKIDELNGNKKTFVENEKIHRKLSPDSTTILTFGPCMLTENYKFFVLYTYGMDAGKCVTCIYLSSCHDVSPNT